MANWSSGWDRRSGHKGQGGSASGYSYLHHNNTGGRNKTGRGGWNFGAEDWDNQYENWGHQKWSTNADDEDWGFGPEPANDPPQIGWGNTGGGRFRSEIAGRKRRGGFRGRRPDRKRPRDFGNFEGKSGKRRQHDSCQTWKQHHDYNYNYYENWNNEYEQAWGGNEYYGYPQRWDQFPTQNWGAAGSDRYDEEAAYTYQFDFGGAYQGGYENPKQLRSGKQEAEKNEGQWKSKVDSVEDKLIFKRHRILTQVKDERKTLVNAVRNIMNAMRVASQVFSKEAQECSEELPSETMDQDFGEKKMPLPLRILLGVIRVGPAVRKLLIKENPDLGAELVAVFKAKPTKEQLERLGVLITENLKSPFSDKVSVDLNEDSEKIIIKLDNSECPHPITISCTSPEYGSEVETVPKFDVDAGEHLSEERCCESLAKIRRVRWSKQMREDLELPVVRIFLDLASRLPGWTHLKPYPAEVLVHTVMDKLSKGVRESELSVSRVFVQSVEVLAGGLVLKSGPGLKDPCEANPTDVFSNLSPQAAEDLTKAAQMGLRLIACNKMKILLDLGS